MSSATVRRAVRRRPALLTIATVVTPVSHVPNAAWRRAAAAARRQAAFGTCETGVTTVAMVSSAGLRRTARRTVAELIAVCRTDDGSAYAARHAADATHIDADGLAAEVTDLCARNRGAQPLDPGTYEVVLSPYAVAEMLEY